MNRQVEAINLDPIRPPEKPESEMNVQELKMHRLLKQIETMPGLMQGRELWELDEADKTKLISKYMARERVMKHLPKK